MWRLKVLFHLAVSIMERKPAMVRKRYMAADITGSSEPAKAMAPATKARNMLLKVSLSFSA